MPENKKIQWHKVLNDKIELPEGRVTTVTANHVGICLTHHKGKLCALDNRCPHQGGPLGEGSIENGLLRCPWHGWDFDPHTGQSPGFHDDSIVTYEVDEREDGIYVGIEEEEEHETSISDVMMETMVAAGVDTVFGMVGHSNLGVAEAMRRLEQKGKLSFIGIRHEGAAAFAASAYGKLTGRPAACFGIAGPGATNMFTGMWDAKNDRAPMLALSGQVQSQVVGTGAFQEVDLIQAFGSVADFNHRVLSNSKHSELMLLAIKHAVINREVSHLTFPDDIQKMPVRKDVSIKTTEYRIAEDKIIPPHKAVADAVALLNKARRPVIIAGHGARFNMDEVIALAEELNAPVLTTFKGKGLISDHHPLGCGVLGRSGTPIASWVMNEADLLCVFGASFSNHTGITSKIPTIQVDYDRLVLAKFHDIEVPVWGEIGVSADIFREKLDNPAAIDQRQDIRQRWDLWLKEKESRLKDDRGEGISSAAVFAAMNKQAPEDAVMCVDVGNNAYSFGRYFETKKHSFLMSGYLGSIGFGYPAAMGAWMAVKGKRAVITVTGDGGFGQYMAEVSTAVKYKMGIKHILINNDELGKISKEQRADQLDVWKTSLHNPNFADFATSCGALGLRVTKQEELENAMKQVFDHDGPATLEVMADVNLI
ncbi:Rieske 2Fe-2S domain-containing protein [Fulvivirga sp. M361]|uniref:thiamine pyrophosphate-dependent enzyme n=1 Tax=Fulvivirga sp. M361 TaxID=2594266 RepID=UPI0011798C01|nr:thiamine pyrophosphate-dependent enzyme [Fulvivirga sp. M361]TRX48303.1 Rieske 2Fe-2S domain-containing protein [Fulvivirga sp. M361]